MKTNVLIADDDASIRFVISKSLSRAGFNVRATDNATTLMKWIRAGEGDVVLSDVHMGQEDIFNFIPDVKDIRADLPIIIMSANTSVMTALKSGKFGVFEYIPKPFDLTILQNVIERAVGQTRQTGKAGSKPSVGEIGPMIGKSLAMQPVYRSISDFSSGDVPVFIYGDVGTGKNLTAELIHQSGKRRDKPFGALMDITSLDMLDSMVADGDLFVDRVDELTSAQQGLLLRAFEKNETYVPEKRFRVISTASSPFQKIQSEGKLRPELFSHLRGGQIYLPPLADRRDDIADLAIYFLNSNPDLDKKRKLSKPALSLLKSTDWDGNVRDLRNLVSAIPLQYSDVMITDEIIKNALRAQFSADIDNSVQLQMIETVRSVARDLLRGANDRPAEMDISLYNQAMVWVEKPLIEEALRLTNGNNVKAAALLGIHRNTLRMKIRSLGINQ